MKRLLIVVAINEEFKIVCKFLKDKKNLSVGKYKRSQGTINGYPVEVLMTSMGHVAAQQAASDILDPREHGGALVLGYCGGLSITLKIGDTVIASQVQGQNPGSALKMDVPLCEALGKAHVREGLTYRCVPMITEPRVIETPREKNELFLKTRAEAVDMESFEVVNLARSRDIPAAAVKVVIDDADTELPRFNDYFEKKGGMDRLNMAPIFVAQPGLIMQLSKFMKRANLILQKSIPAMVESCCTHWQIKQS